MMHRIRIFSYVLSAVLLWTLSSVQPVSAAIPLQLAWQGVALDSLDVPLADGMYTFHFAIFSEDLGGDSLWGESQTVDVQDGVISILLGRNTPIPDTVFAGAARFLQVQFEDQVPYVPRTRIVSVGYSYRTGSVDGAQGGVVASDVEVTGAVTAESFAVPGAEAAASGGTESANPPVVHVGQQSAGGQVIVGSDVTLSNGIVMEGDNGGSGEPRFAVIGSQAAFELDLSGGGLELVLPPDAINSAQIIDEPGISVGVQPGAILDTQDEYNSIASATATFPADGFVLVITEATFRSDTTGSWVDGQLRLNGSSVADWYWEPGDDDDYFDQRQSYTYAAAVTASTQTYELAVRQPVGSSDVVDGKVTVVYFPTSYGAVMAQSDMGAGGPVTTVQAAPPVVTSVDVPAERAAAVAANQLRIEREIEALQIQLDNLRNELAQSRGLLSTGP